MQEAFLKSLKGEDVLEILKELGGCGTHSQVRDIAIRKGFDTSTLGKRFELLCKWCEVTYFYDYKKGNKGWKITPQFTKSKEEIEHEEREAMKNIIILNRSSEDNVMLSQIGNSGGRYCAGCDERLTIFDEIVFINFNERKHYCHKSCKGKAKKALSKFQL